MSKEYADKLQWILVLIVVVVIIAAFLQLPQSLVNWMVEWLVSAFIGTVFSMVAAAIVEGFTGNFLKTISFTIEIKGFKFSITAFAIATIAVKYLLFHQF